MAAAPNDVERAWLDAEYNARAGIPDHQDIFARWTRDSATLQDHERSRAKLDVSYGPDPLQAFDVYPARHSTGADPLLVFVHGGYWQSLDKSQFGFLAEPYISRGICFAAVNYRLAPDVGMDEIVEDVRSAVGSLYERAPEYGADPAQLYLSGHSAGGHLTAMLMSTAWPELGLPADIIKGGCAISGLYDLEPIQNCYLNDVLGMDIATSQRNSPVQHAPSSSAPLLLTVGGDESSEFHRQQAEFARIWSTRGLACKVVDQPDGHHFDAVERLGEADDPLFGAVFELIRNA
ncbi:alpha/beta hydrolase [Saccharopolyspora elongata]|uniref:Alpha/beta hydrolase n=1 Tax=Saccharopolyspora elongata TaxID=2530387 RepID=A0A4V2YKG1_9PSEU|nr:alpha/beta hydrolase [Saccharopolyspora elongata]TDD42317.1 alpha/beta hydrolase [Saccharopolyspora elongata]